MKSNMKRIAAVVLAVMMVLSMLPGAMAAEYFSGSLSVGGRVKRATPAPTAAPVEETPAPEATEVPAEEPTEEPVIEETEPTEEPTVEETAAPEVEPTEAPVEPEATAEPEATVEPEATAEPEVTPEPTPEVLIGMIYKKGDDNVANIRALPTSDSDRLGKAHHGDMLTVYDQEGSWLYVEVIGIMGWVHGNMVTFDESLFGAANPTVEPTAEPTEEPVVEETEELVVEETEEPVVEETEEPVVEETEEPVVEETEEPVVEETEEPVVEETEEPVVEETEEPVVEETEEPVVEETEEPVVEETEEPVIEETEEPVVEETEEPVVEETEEPTEVLEPTEEQIVVETESEFQLDENGEVILDENGNPIPVVIEVTEEAIVEEIVEINIRLDADGLSEIILTVPVETAAAVLGVEGDWVNVDVEGTVGYIFIDDAELMPNLTGMPEIEETPAPEENVDPTANMKVTIFTSRRSVVAPGETIYLTSKIEGFEGFEIMYVWECDKGNGFEAIEGAHADTYSFAASIETLSYDWRLTVYYR